MKQLVLFVCASLTGCGERREAIDWLASDALSKVTNGVSTLTVK